MSELEGLDQPLTLQIRETPLLRQLRRLAQARERPLEIVKTLDLADVGIAHGQECSGMDGLGKLGNLTSLR